MEACSGWPAAEEGQESQPRGGSDGPVPREELTPAGMSQDQQRCQLGSRERNGKKSTVSSSSDFSDPVYKEIAVTNGHINRMSKEELRAKLSEFKLETRGVKDVLKKRLKNYYKKEKLTQQREDGGTNSYFDYICIIDFEATCEEGNPPDFTHEIIEFPVVLLNTHTLEIEDTFQQYVKPEINAQLSDFCINLTGITQDMVDRADTFPQVLQNVVDWMRQKELGTKYKYSILTDGGVWAGRRGDRNHRRPSEGTAAGRRYRCLWSKLTLSPHRLHLLVSQHFKAS
ncbi:3'-5' exoribonuclease 1 isoform X2 [Notamacropus eugenii]|uniref:3'-5' exoribonuclease 1 isoform X2 n=1 Tax=Notamacropus eugenii TaxID=9315 RepID=UPI003B66B6AE